MQVTPTENTTEGGRHVCCICGEPVSAPYNLIGQRIYCDRHFALVNKPHAGFWRSALVQILGMGVFSVVVIIIGDYVGPIGDPWGVLVGVALALVPSALW